MLLMLLMLLMSGHEGKVESDEKFKCSSEFLNLQMRLTRAEYRVILNK